MQIMTSDADDRILCRLRDGSIELARWQTYVSGIRAWICSRFPQVSNHAEDLADEAAIRAFINLDSFRGDASFTQWTNRVAYFVVCAHLRKSSSRPEVSLDNPVIEPVSTDSIEDRLTIWSMDSAIKSMTCLEREVFVRRAAYASEHKDIADKLGITSNASRQSWMRAVKKVRVLHQETAN